MLKDALDSSLKDAILMVSFTNGESVGQEKDEKKEERECWAQKS